VLVNYSNGNDAFWLITSAEYFNNSAIFASLVEGTFAASVGVDIARATYGQMWSFWTFLSNDASTTALGAVDPDGIIFSGTKAGVGTAFRWGLSAADPINLTGTVNTKFTNTDHTSANVALIKAPIGGVGQFKGLTQGTT
jgi:hypothetical protein